MSTKLPIANATHQWAPATPPPGGVQHRTAFEPLAWWAGLPRGVKWAVAVVAMLWLAKAVVGTILALLFLWLARLGTLLIGLAILAFVLSQRNK
jgi:hypothetical protein